MSTAGEKHSKIHTVIFKRILHYIDNHIIQYSTSAIQLAGQSYSYRLLVTRTFRWSVTWLISLRLRANRISRAPT